MERTGNLDNALRQNIAQGFIEHRSLFAVALETSDLFSHVLSPYRCALNLLKFSLVRTKFVL